MTVLQTRVTDEDRILAAYRGGMPIDVIVSRSRLSEPLVRTVLSSAGVLPPRRGRPWPYTAEAERAIATSYAGGASMNELMARHGGCHRALRTVLIGRGIPIRRPGRPRRSTGTGV